nr:MAG TPA: hypothetical protein [Caudoviricetes sp.]
MVEEVSRVEPVYLVGLSFKSKRGAILIKRP